MLSATAAQPVHPRLFVGALLLVLPLILGLLVLWQQKSGPWIVLKEPAVKSILLRAPGIFFTGLADVSGQSPLGSTRQGFRTPSSEAGFDTDVSPYQDDYPGERSQTSPTQNE